MKYSERLSNNEITHCAFLRLRSLAARQGISRDRVGLSAVRRYRRYRRDRSTTGKLLNDTQLVAAAAAAAANDHQNYQGCNDILRVVRREYPRKQSQKLEC